MAISIAVVLGNHTITIEESQTKHKVGHYVFKMKGSEEMTINAIIFGSYFNYSFNQIYLLCILLSNHRVKIYCQMTTRKIQL